MAKGIHLFPYRTQKLSLSAPMVLGWRRPGRVGRCRIPGKKNSPLMGWVLFSFHLQRSSPKSSLTERSTYLVRISTPAPCGRNRGGDITWESQNRNAFFSDCPNQCAALYLVRILTAARCAGFRQAKSPGRVGRCRCGGAHSMSQRGVYGKERDNAG